MNKKILIILWISAIAFMTYGCQRSDDTTPEMAQSILKLRGFNFTEADFLRAVKLEDAVAVKGFLQAGINPNAKNEKGETALTAAIETGEPKTIRLLLDTADINMRDDLGNSPLHLALKKNEMDVFESLLEKNADVNVPGKGERANNQSVLYVAVYRNDEDLVKKLLERGANPNLADSDGALPLSEAVLGSDVNPEIVKMLLDKGANPDIQEKNKATALIYIAANAQTTAHKRRQVIKMLLEKGADKSIKDEKGNTALDWAKKNGNKEVVEILK
ncbi:MAG: ankyrin repeat domain-containing protein [Acidobacteria bacterium]|nr:ankyrin repeat domain-containing protein [Acidobacteriota bacterium]